MQVVCLDASEWHKFVQVEFLSQVESLDACEDHFASLSVATNITNINSIIEFVMQVFFLDVHYITTTNPHP